MTGEGGIPAVSFRIGGCWITCRRRRPTDGASDQNRMASASGGTGWRFPGVISSSEAIRHAAEDRGNRSSHLHEWNPRRRVAGAPTRVRQDTGPSSPRQDWSKPPAPSGGRDLMVDAGLSRRRLRSRPSSVGFRGRIVGVNAEDGTAEAVIDAIRIGEPPRSRKVGSSTGCGRAGEARVRTRRARKPPNPDHAIGKRRGL